MFKKTALIFTTFIFLLPTGYADENSHRQVANEMLSVLEADKMLDAMYKQLDQFFVTMSREITAKLDVPAEKQPMLKEQLSKYMAKSSALIQEELTWEKLKPQMIDLYVKVYTESELKELIVFYKSPIGQKLLAKMPQIMQESMKISQSQMASLLPKIQALSKEMVAELRRNEE